jgi:hypothetical protein
LSLKFVQNVSSWIFFNSISLSENAKNSIQIFEMPEVYPCVRIVYQQKQAMND